MDDWLERPAEYADIRRSLHLLLIAFLGLPPGEAVTYNPHGFRHTLVSIGQQLRSYGIISEPDLEILGHWSKGSDMPRRYDSAKGVTELRARTTLMETVRTSWRPAKNGSLPCPPSASSYPPREVPDPRGDGGPRSRSVPDLSGSSSLLCPPSEVLVDPGGGGRLEARSFSDLSSSSGVRLVGHTRRHRIHLVGHGSLLTVCKMWTCGDPGSPTAFATFCDISDTWDRCRNCFR